MPGQAVRDPRGLRGPGGTWDLFRYPGVRSELLDMYTLSYPFRPWKKGPRSMVDGPSIWAYIRDTAA